MAFEGTQRYEIRRRLGQGGMGIVYEAYDRERDALVALKTLKNLDPDSLLRFKQEFRSVQGVEHPNLVSLGELVAHHDHWFFTMELVEGRNFLAYVRPDELKRERRMVTSPTVPFISGLPQARFDEARLRGCVAELASGLSALHAAGKVHRDVKPSNVLVTRSGHTVLLDFGLAIAADKLSQPIATHAVGTAAYMAPEQAALKVVGPAADWYSVGVMIYQAMTGHLPFTGTSFEIATSKQRAEPSPPSERCSGIPADLDELCRELLYFDPERRPGEEEILRRLGAAPPSAAASSHYSHDILLVGRDRELSDLREAFDAARTTAVTVVVHGESGIGKSVLLEHFADLATVERGDVVTLTGRCYARESIPFKAVDGVVDSLAAYLGKLSEAEVMALLPAGAPLLRQMFPVLGRVEAIAQAPELERPIRDHLERQRRTFVALRELLHNIAVFRRLIVIIDDLQWADSDSLTLLADLLRPPNPPPLLLLISSRESDVLRSIADAPTRQSQASLPGRIEIMELGKLSEQDAILLARKLIARAGIDHVEPRDLVNEAQGHPLFLDELVRHAVISGLATCPRLETAIMARVEHLAEDARALLELVVVAGAPMSEEALRLASRLEPDTFARTLSLLRAANLVRGVGSRHSDQVEPFHDRVRETVTSQLDGETLHQRHLRLSIALEATSGRPELLIRHLEAAGEAKKAAAYAERAARRASLSLAFDRAVNFYQTALRLGEWDEGVRRELNIELCDALTNAGRGAEAAEAALAAARGADRTTRLEYMRRAAEQQLICGHIETGLATLSQVLREVSGHMPTSPRRALVKLIWHRAALRLRGVGWKQRHEKEIAASDLLRIDVHMAASHGLSMVDNVRGAYFQVRGLRLALKAGEPQRLAWAFGLEAIYYASQGIKAMRRARRLHEHTRRLAEADGGAVLRGFDLVVDGVLRYFGGEFPTAADRLQRAVDVFREETTGRTWELNNARMFLLFSLRHMGAFGSVGELYDDYVRDAARRGDRYFEASLRLYGNEVFLARDDTDGAAQNLAQVRWVPFEGRFHLQHWYELEARAELALYSQRATEARTELAPRFDGLARSLLTRIMIIRALAYFLRGKLAVAAVAEGATEIGLLREASECARDLDALKLEHTRMWACMLRAGVAFQENEPQRCADHLRHALELATKLDMRFYAAAARYRLGELVGGSEGAAMVGEAVTWLEGQGVVRPEAMVRIASPGCGR